MAAPPQLPFKRLVVLDALSTAGCYAVEALLESSRPFYGLPIVVAAWQPVAHHDNVVSAAASTAMLAELVKTTKHPSLTIAKAPKELRIDPATDLLIYVTRRFESRTLEEAVSLMPAAAKLKGPAPALLLITGDGAHVPAQVVLGAAAKAWRVCHARTVALAPPTCARPRPPGAAVFADLISPIENFALGLALGVTRFFKVNASQPADVVPIDVAIQAGFAAFALHAVGKYPSSTANANHISMNILANTESSLVWGMVGEYVLDYYGRFGTAIAKAIPGDAFSCDTTIAFNAHFPDLWNYGLALTTPLEMYRQSTASRTKTHLLKYPHSTTAEKMAAALRRLDESLDTVHRQTPVGRGKYDNSTYLMLLRRLSVDRESSALFHAASLSGVKWEGYIKRIAVHMLHYLANGLLNHDTPPALPQPVPVFHNDLFFQGTERAPEPNLVLRRWMDDVHMVLRGGQQPNGLPVSFTPGGTQRTFLGILAQSHVQRLITQIADEQYLARDDVEARAMGILRQIGDTLNHSQARTLAYILRKVFKTLYTRVTINDGAYDTLFKLFNTPRTSVVVMPSHRSYMDFIILSYMLLVMGFPLPHICSGEDFLSLGGISEMLRGSGAFFMRRSFKNDKLYGALFKEYVRNLVRRGQCIEFFIEGTRSRTQRTMGPKVGLLKIVTDAFLEPQQEINDVVLLPVSLSYEKILEGNVYANELLGVPKPKETPMNLLKSASVLSEKFGSFNVSFGQPISVADFSADPDQVPAGFKRKAMEPTSKAEAAAQKAPSGPPSDGGSDRGGGGTSYTPSRVLTRLAWRVTYELQRNLVVTPTALISAVLLHMFDHTELREAGVPMAAVASNVEWLRSVVLRNNGHMNHEYAAFDGLSLLKYAVKHLNPHVWISPLSRVYMANNSVATYMLLSMYTNQLVHLFGDEGTMVVAAASLAALSSAALAPSPSQLTEAALKKLGGGGGGTKPSAVAAATPSTVIGGDDDAVFHQAPFHVSRVALQAQTRSVRNLLWHELPDFQAPNPTDAASAFTACLARMADRKCAADDPTTVQINPNTFTNFVAQLAYPCIESYFVAHVAIAVLRTAHRMPESVLVTLAHKVALELYDRKLVQYVQCSNKETLKNAVTRALEMQTVVFERSGRTATIALPAEERNGAPRLQARTQEINLMRNRSSAPGDVLKCVAVAQEIFGSMRKLQAKL